MLILAISHKQHLNIATQVLEILHDPFNIQKDQFYFSVRSQKIRPTPFISVYDKDFPNLKLLELQLGSKDARVSQI